MLHFTISGICMLLGLVWGITVLGWISDAYAMAKGLTWLAFIALSLFFNLLNFFLAIAAAVSNDTSTQHIISE